MCIKLLSKTLNPKAAEWRPNLKQPISPPHLLIPPPQTAFNIALAPPYYPQNPHPIDHRGFLHYDAHTDCWPLYYSTFPVHGIHYIKAATAAKSKPEVEKTSFAKRKTVIPIVKSRKCPPSDHASKDQDLKRAYPPRLRMLRRRSCADTHRREWRPRKSANADCKVSGDGDASASPPPLGGRHRIPHFKNTTVMIKNIPNKLRRDFMLKFLDDYCKTYSLEYDFLYLPIDFWKKGNLGYAFVNFTSTVAALKFKKILQNFHWGVVYVEGQSFASNKICDITWARIQGKEALVERFQKSSFACDRLDFLPVVLDPPRNGTDPNPAPPVVLGSLDRSALRNDD